MSDTLHLVAFPHTQTTSAYATCAYTQKINKFCRMMTGRGRKVVLYSGEENEAPCDEHVPCLSTERQREWFGEPDENDLGRGGMNWGPDSPWWVEFNSRVAAEVSSRADQHDLLLLSMGQSQQLIADVNPYLTVAEYGVGYEGVLNVGAAPRRRGGPAFCAFESVAFQHLVYGRWQMQNRMNERWYDTVIPNYFDPDEFDPVREHDGYLLFVGRLISLKGAHVAAQIARELGMPLMVAGGGGLEHGDGFVRAAEVTVEAPGLTYLGPVSIRQRAELMAGAAVLLAPTLYVEPFGGVAVEAMMAGCPAVTTDWGAFTETVREGVSGYRFHTIAEGCEAVYAASGLDRMRVRQYAHDRYSLNAVAPLYERWFDRLDGLWDRDWAAPPTRGLVGTATIDMDG